MPSTIVPIEKLEEFSPDELARYYCKNNTDSKYPLEKLLSLGMNTDWVDNRGLGIINIKIEQEQPLTIHELNTLLDLNSPVELFYEFDMLEDIDYGYLHFGPDIISYLFNSGDQEVLMKLMEMFYEDINCKYSVVPYRILEGRGQTYGVKRPATFTESTNIYELLEYDLRDQVIEKLVKADLFVIRWNMRKYIKKSTFIKLWMISTIHVYFRFLGTAITTIKSLTSKEASISPLMFGIKPND